MLKLGRVLASWCKVLWDSSERRSCVRVFRMRPVTSCFSASLRCCLFRVPRSGVACARSRNRHVDLSAGWAERPHRSKSVSERRHFESSGDVSESFFSEVQKEANQAMNRNADDVGDYIYIYFLPIMA